MTFNKIADHLNEKNILSTRGKKFSGAHVHSIMKRKRMRDEKLEREYPEVRSIFIWVVMIRVFCLVLL